jgi:hypothetical protein
MKPALALVATVLAFGVVAGGAHAAAPAEFFGVNAGQVFGGGNEAENTRAMAAGGLQVVRSVASTQLPGQHGAAGYYWFSEDLAEENMAAAGLRWYPFIGYAAGQPDTTEAPALPASYAAYAAAVARRYGPGGSFWHERPALPPLPVTTYEIWNEENSVTFWSSQADAPERYADLYMQTRAAIKAVDPNATVAVGGLALGQPNEATDEIEFLRRMFAYRPDLRGNVDAVALHPYQRTVADVYLRIAKFRKALDQLAGPQVPVEITEIGWSSGSVSEDERSNDLGILANTLPRSDCNITRMMPFQWAGTPQSPDSDFAIANWDATLLPSGQAYVDAVHTMRGLSPTPAPSGSVKICHPDTPRRARPAGPRLRLAVRRDRRHSRVRVTAHCTAGCKLRTELLAARTGSRHLRRLAVKRFGLSRRPRRFSLRVPHGLRRIELRVMATGRTGGRTSRTRSVTMRRVR